MIGKAMDDSFRRGMVVGVSLTFAVIAAMKLLGVG